MTKRVRMPGFTGEVSLEPAAKPYSSGRYKPREFTTAAVIPQLSLGSAGRVPCNPNCVCVTGENCPCCYDMTTPEMFVKAR